MRNIFKQLRFSWKNILIIVFLIFILILIYSSINFNRFNYLSDNIKSFYYSIVSNFTNNSFSVIDIPDIKYVKPYENIPEEFTYFGNTLFMKVLRGEKLSDIADKSIKYTYFYNAAKLKDAIMKYNGLENSVIPTDMKLYLPYSIPSVTTDIKNYNKPEMIYTRGLYFTGTSIGSERIFDKLARFKSVGINTVVFDAKDINGDVNYLSSIPDVVTLNTHEKRTIDNIDRMIRIFRKAGIYTIARIAVFRDHLLCSVRPDLAIRSKRSGNVWNQSTKELWCDPTNKFVQDYNINLAIELAEKGVDEIQFDYIRFPTSGDLNDALYTNHFGNLSKEDTITLFLKRAYEEISARNTYVSIDIFGVVAWGKEADIRKTGQRVERLSKYCDVISPMLYPSHFSDDFNGFANPGDEPYHFIYYGSLKTKALANGRKIRPWLQAFGWRISNYNDDYILKQIAASRDAEASGYLFWNSSNSYDYVYKALERLTTLKKEISSNP